MRSLVIVAALAVPARADVAWADVVGDWSATLRWSSCAAAGATKAAIAIDATNGVLAIDLAATSKYLASYALLPTDDAKALEAQHGDIALTVAPTGTDKLALAVRVGTAGCTLRAELARPRPSCALDAWTRIAKRCTREPIDFPTKGTCREQAATLEHAVVEAGCAPSSNARFVARSHCQRLPQVAQQVNQCPKLDQAQRDAFTKLAATMVGAAQSVDQTSAATLDQQCDDIAVGMRARARTFGCP